MPERDRGYYRFQRRKHIKAKKLKASSWGDYFFFDHEGKLDKGKIHCSCWMCRAKTYDSYKHSDEIKIERLNSSEEDFENENLDFLEEI